MMTIPRCSFLTLLAFASIALGAAPSPAAAQADLSPQAKACDSNLRTIEGGVELLLMDEPSAATAELSVPFLKDKGILKSTPACPQGGVYSIRVTLLENTPYPEASCSLHGKAGAVHEAASAPPAEPAKPEAAAPAAEPATPPANPASAGTPPPPGAAPPVKETPLPEPAKAEPAPAAEPTKRPFPPEEGRKICRAHLQELVGAGMMVLMKKNITTTLVYTPAQLVAEKFLKREKTCPNGGEYTVEITGKNSSATCSKHGGR